MFEFHDESETGEEEGEGFEVVAGTNLCFKSHRRCEEPRLWEDKCGSYNQLEG